MSPAPAYVLGPRWEILAWNDAQARLYPAVVELDGIERNLLWILFADPFAQELIVDWDVHHGNGTQDLLWSEPRTLFISSHQMPLYPGSGAAHETGVSNNVLNVPLDPHTGGKGFRAAYEAQVFPALDDFQPELVLISAGFDAHYRHPLAGLRLEDNDFDWATGKLMEIADKHCESRVVSLLEGGYDLEGLAESTAAHVNRLMTG